MDSAGNDIVAFRLTDPERSAQPRFYQQILSPSETDLFHSGAVPNLSPPGLPGHSGPVPDFHLFLWLCWSVKESVYKYRKRGQSDLVYSPTSISVQEIIATDNQIHGRSEDLFFRTILIPNGIHTVVHRDPAFSGVHSGYGFVQQTTGHEDPKAGQGSTPGIQSTAVRELVSSDLRKWDPTDGWSFGKHVDGYPLLYKDGILQSIPLSLAHHDQLLGFSYFLPGS